MRILIVRNAAAECEPDCAEWISAEGDITSATPALLRKILKAAAGKKLPFIISSPGGDVTASYAMGRLIRQAGLEVTVGQTVLVPCAPAEKKCSDTMVRGRRGWANNVNSFCNSACVFVLAGGVARHAYWVSEIGVHQFASTRTLTRWRDTTRNGRVIRRQILSVSRVAVQTSRAQYDRAAHYFDEMGIDPSINGLVQLAENKDIHVMDSRELLATRIITDDRDAWGLIIQSQTALNAQRIAERAASFKSTAADIPAGLYDGKAMISHVELREAPDGGGVEASITSRIGSGAVPATELLATVQVGNTLALSALPGSVGPPGPALTITLAPATFCVLGNRQPLDFTIGPKENGPVASETVTVSTRRFRDLDVLLYKVCEK